MKNLVKNYLLILGLIMIGFTSCEPETEFVQVQIPGETLLILQEVPTSISGNQLFEGDQDEMSFDLRFTLPRDMTLHSIIIHRKMSDNINVPIDEIYENILVYNGDSTNPFEGSFFGDLEPSQNGFMQTTMDVDQVTINADEEFFFKFTESLNFIEEIEGDIVSTSYIELVLSEGDDEPVILQSSQFTQLIEQYEFVEFVVNDDGGNHDFYTIPNDNEEEYRFLRAEIDYDGADGDINEIDVTFNISNILLSGLELNSLLTEAFIDIDNEDFDISFPSTQTTAGSMIATVTFSNLDDVNISDGTFDLRVELGINEYAPDTALAGINIKIESVTLKGETEYGETFSETLITDFSPYVYIGNDYLIIEYVDIDPWVNNGTYLERDIEMEIENYGEDTGYITDGSNGFLFSLNGETLTASELNNLIGYSVIVEDSNNDNFLIQEGDEGEYEITLIAPPGGTQPEFLGFNWNDDGGYFGTTSVDEY